MRGRRQRLGQWFTPAAVAELALSLALDGRAPRRVLDPTCGDGVFLAAARDRGIDCGRLVGVDVDPAAAGVAEARVPGARIVGADLFDLEAGDLRADVVVGNPPYVRQERLDPAAKSRVRTRLAADWPGREVTGLVGRGDLSVACLARVVRLLEPGGRAALVVSTALLDAGYARALWRLVLDEARVVCVVEAPRERWFADAAVNTCIVVLERAPAGAPVTIARLRASTDAAAQRVRRVADLAGLADLRVAPAGDPGRWAALLRAPQAWLDVEGAAGDALVPLGELAEVRRGVTSGANDFFYLPRDRADTSGIESALLRPLVRSPRDRSASGIDVDLDACDHLALCLPPDEDALARFPGAARYVAAGAQVAARRTLRGRRPWWALPTQPARLFLAKSYAARFVQRLAPAPVVADQRVYALTPRPGVDADALCAVLNTSFGALALEALGRASLGEGALEWTVGDARVLPVLDPRGREDALARALAPLRQRRIGDVGQERRQSDRAALDRAAAPALVALLPSVHDALEESTARRARRARS